MFKEYDDENEPKAVDTPLPENNQDIDTTGEDVHEGELSEANLVVDEMIVDGTVSQEAVEEVNAEAVEHDAEPEPPKTKIGAYLRKEGKYFNKANSGIIVFCIILVFGIFMYVQLFRTGMITKEKFGVGRADRPIVYSKGDSMYINDLKHDSVMVDEDLTEDGGSISYKYVGGGVSVSKNGKGVFFIDGVKADGSFDLKYRKAAANSEDAAVLAEDILDYAISYKGNSAVYIKDDDNVSDSFGTLMTTDLKSSYKIADGFTLGDTYGLSADGKNVYFTKNENGFPILYSSDIQGENITKIDEAITKLIIPEKSNDVYYVKAEGVTAENAATLTEYSYSIYCIENGVSKIVTENATGISILDNQEGIVYYKDNKDTTSAKDIIIDDMAEKDAALKEPVFSDYGNNNIEGYYTAAAEYEDKKNRDELRKSINELKISELGDGLYIYKDGASELIFDSVYSAKALDPKGNYIAYSVPKSKDKIKVNLSEITTDADLQSIYYQKTGESPVDVFITKRGAYTGKVEAENVLMSSLTMSADSKTVTLIKNYDTEKASGQLVLVGLDDKGIAYYADLEENVKGAQFTGIKSKFAYLGGVKDGAGTLYYMENRVQDIVSDSCVSFRTADDNFGSVYYIDKYDTKAEGGTLHYYESGGDIEIDTGVYAMTYRENKRTLYLKNYDPTTETGDLYVLDGKKAKLVDTGVSCIFDF